jgi:Mannosyl-glycoprotein endo-beta-N-acetylglucosaminidase
MRKIRCGMVCLIVALICLSLQDALCQDKHLNYIAQFKNLAIQEQRLTGIPASIKLSMALLESNAGQSYLATKGNNHFGIKWWNAANDGAHYIETFDDDKNRHGKPIPSRFIKFATVQESYKKHSAVLLRPRYAVLFTYPPTDYRAWASGLETCGYATARGYGQLLIDLIEKYNLTQYDLPPEPEPDSISFEKSPSFEDNRTPQYSSPVRQVKFVSERKDPLPPPSNLLIESHFTNKKGQKMHFVLSEAE